MSWKESKISDVCILKNGYAFKSSSFDKVGTPIIRINNISNELVTIGENAIFVDTSVLKNIEEFKVSKGDILIALSGATTGKFGIYNSDQEALLNQRVGKIRSKNEKEVDNNYLKYCFYSLVEKIRNKAQGGAQPNISLSTIGDFKISIPDFQTQQQIVAVLDKAQALIKKRNQSLKLLDELLQSTFLEMFGDPVLNNKKWGKEILKNCTIKIGSGSTPRGGKDAYKTSGISLVRSLNVYDNQFRYKNLAYIDDDQANKLKNVELFKNDVLFNITGASVCRCTIVPEEILPARVNQHVAILRVDKKKLNATFLCHLLISANSKLDLLRIGQRGGATREAITKDQLENYKIIIPPIKNQNSFVSIASKINIQKELITSGLDETKNLFQSLLQDTFNGKLKLLQNLSIEVILEQYELNANTTIEKKRNQELIKLLGKSKKELDIFKTMISKSEFKNIDDYEKAKSLLFEMINKSKVSQKFDRVKQEVILK